LQQGSGSLDCSDADSVDLIGRSEKTVMLQVLGLKSADSTVKKT
jgi:hypothetical protein